MDIDKDHIVDYLNMDLDGDFILSKNEWMIACAKLLMNDIHGLQKEGPDSFMKHMLEFSKEFDKYDTDDNYFLEIKEYKNMVRDTFYIED